WGRDLLEQVVFESVGRSLESWIEGEAGEGEKVMELGEGQLEPDRRRLRLGGSLAAPVAFLGRGHDGRRDLGAPCPGIGQGMGLDRLWQLREATPGFGADDLAAQDRIAGGPLEVRDGEDVTEPGFGLADPVGKLLAR